MTPQQDHATRILRERFALDALYSLQRMVIDHVLAGRHAMVVMPTGGGKSLCFQLPALTLAEGARLDARPPGVTLVFSPLIALMEDQVSALRRKGVRATYINSALSRAEREKRQNALAQGRWEIIYATPERMGRPGFAEALASVPGGVNLLAIDEAHCISKWGHDLRPAYQRVGEFRKVLGDPVTLALTATATPRVREDIRETLALDDDAMALFAAPVDRPNLTYEIREVWDDADKFEAIESVRESATGTGIVYYALIKDLERARDALRARWKPEARPIEIYHGKLDPREKRRVLARFLQAPPEENLTLLATNAFGMGVDKPDIRFIIHAQMPGSVEAYAQETGRAGRDNMPSRCLMLLASDDLAIQQTFATWANPPRALLEETCAAIFRRYGRAGHDHFNHDDIYLDVIGKGRGDQRLAYALIRLEAMGVIEAAAEPGSWRPAREPEPGEFDDDEIEAKKKRDLLRLLDVLNLARSPDPRRFVIDYFDLAPTPLNA